MHFELTNVWKIIRLAFIIATNMRFQTKFPVIFAEFQTDYFFLFFLKKSSRTSKILSLTYRKTLVSVLFGLNFGHYFYWRNL